MYKHFFGLRDNPFNANPDPRYLFLTAQTQEALDEMTYGIQSRKGLILLTGEVGTGKTTLINRLLDLLHQQGTPTAFIFNSHLETSHLYEFIMADFGVPFDPQQKGSALMRLNEWLIERFRAGRTPVLIVDEAQGLPIHLLEEIRMLLNLETSNEKLLQIVLSGQPELEERLRRPELRQLKQRITLRCKTSALTVHETRQYIHSRLQIAGAGGKPVYAPEAVDAVHFYSRGIPRVVNLLCEHALINAYVEQARPVPVQIIDEIAREFQFDDIKPLAASMDSSNTLSAHAIAMQSTLPSGLVRTPETAEPLPLPKRMETRPPLVSTAFGSDAGFQLIAELATERVPQVLPPRPSLVDAKRKVDRVHGDSRRQLGNPEKASRLAIRVNESRSIAVTSRLMTFVALAAHSSAELRDRLLSAFNCIPWTQINAKFLRRMEPSLLSIRAWYGRFAARRDKTLTSIGFDDWPHMKASLYQWFRQPCDPLGWLHHGWDSIHLRLPDSFLFEARRRFSHRKT
jgi:general secretion pathway protein A